MRADRQTVERLLKTARGQIDGVLKMVEENQYCIDISNQVMAAEAVLRKANKEIIKAHLHSCVVEAIQQGDDENASKKIEEIIFVVDKLSK